MNLPQKQFSLNRGASRKQSPISYPTPKLIRMKSIAVFFAALFLAVSANATLFFAQLDGSQVNPPNSTSSGFTPAGGHAVMSVDLNTSQWSMVSGVYSNLSSSAISAGIFGPAPIGQNASILFPLGFDYKPEGPLSGLGTFSDEQLSWLLSGLLYVSVGTGDYENGQIRGQLLLVSDPDTDPDPDPVSVPDSGSSVIYALIAGLSLCGFATRYRREKGGRAPL